MFNTHSDRLDYRELMSPPYRYKVSFAVGTTYSLDLETLTAMCAIVGLNVEADTELAESPLHMLEAIRRASTKLLIFCQGGQIKTPDKPNKLLPLLENCVCEVNLKNKKSFHPKTWFIQYTAKGLPDKYRLIVLSRNLTFDRSWDVAVRLDSADRGDAVLTQDKNTGELMGEFIHWLIKNTAAHNPALRKKHRLIDKIAEGFSTAKWKSVSREFDSFGFIPYGIDSSVTNNLFDTFHKLFVISPFLSKGVIKRFADNRLINPDCTLITRSSELPKLDENLLSVFDTYIVKDVVVGGEESVFESGEAQKQDIHAKVFLRTKWSDSELYIGSANASHSAFFGGNVECMLVLRGKQRHLNVDKLKSDLFGSDEKKNPFERAELAVVTESDDDAVMQKLEEAIREFCAAKKTAAVSGDDPYSVMVKLKPLQSDIRFTLSPLMKPNPQPVSETVIFNRLGLRDLSEWYAITVKTKGKELRRVVKIQTEGIPENRDKAVFSDVIRDKNAFLTYIAFLLSDDYLTALLEGIKSGKGEYRFLNMNYDAPILYERMLKAAANSPDSLRDIRDIIEMMNDGIVPQDFLRLYEQFEKAVKL
jgi:hypothetical protein